MDVGFVRGDLSMLPLAGRTLDKALCTNMLQMYQRICHEENVFRSWCGSGVLDPMLWCLYTTFRSRRKRKVGGVKNEVDLGIYSGRVSYIYRFEKKEFRYLLKSSLLVDSITGAGLPLPYKLKLSPLHFRLERILRRFGYLSSWAHMLVRVCGVTDMGYENVP